LVSWTHRSWRAMTMFKVNHKLRITEVPEVLGCRGELAGWEWMFLDAMVLPEQLRYWEENKNKKILVHLSSSRVSASQFPVGILDEILTEARGLFIQDDLTDLQFIEKNTQLEVLTTGDLPGRFKLANPSGLKFATLKASTLPRNFLECDNLVELRLDGGIDVRYNHFSLLKSLELVRPKIHDLSGIKGLGLRRLSVAYASNLRDISSLDNSQSTEMIGLGFQNCKKIANWSALSALGNLQVLEIHRCADVESIKFLDKFHALRQLIISDTNIVDGKIAGIVSRLNESGGIVAITPHKRHYD
jgi:hypothetical protein